MGEWECKWVCLFYTRNGIDMVFESGGVRFFERADEVITKC